MSSVGGRLDARVGGAAGAKTGRIPRITEMLFVWFAAYLACPVVEVPVIGLSLSAPLFYLIAVRLYTGGGVRLRDHVPAITFAYVFWVALLSTLVVNALADSAFRVSTADLKLLLNFAYWMVVLVSTAILVSSHSRPRMLVAGLGMGIVALASVRLFEVVVYGNWGAWTGTRFMTQNEYGIQFSVFGPYALALPMLTTGWKRAASVLGLLAVWTAAVGNGSRSSWIALALGAVLFTVLSAATRRGGFVRLWRPVVALGCLAMVFALLPGSVVGPVVARYESMQRLDTDKSYQIRILMIQKSVRLFEQKPLFGAGIGHFGQTRVDLDRPDILMGRSLENYNQRSAHNSYAALLGEAGLAGVVPFAALLLTLALAGARAAMRLARRGEQWALVGYVSLVTMSVHLWSLSGLTSTSAWFVYGVVAGLIVRARRTRPLPAVAR